jgi:transcriptional regulator, propionate catabolism operon regulatory protein
VNADQLLPARQPPQGSSRPVRLCLLSYTSLSRVARTVLHEFAGRAEIEVFDETFGSALDVASARERLGVVDAFVSAGGNAAMLRGTVKSPVASIVIGGFDLLLALIKASKHSRRIGVVTYGRTVPDLDAVKSVLKLDVEQRSYHNYEEAAQATRELAELGCAVMVGSSVVVESAERLGLHGILAYSPSGIRRGIEDAIELARVARLEAARHALLGGVLGSLQEAVLAVDEAGRLLAANPPMEALLGQPLSSLAGQPLLEVAPALAAAAMGWKDSGTGGKVLQFGNREWIARRSPIRDGEAVAGATLTLYDAQTIQEADVSLRTQRKASRLPVARHSFAELKGASAVMKQTVATAERYAHSHLTVLLSGESGTGKEMFAQAIHNASPRADRPFIALNCAAFPEALLESELFGYEEGAFTGARRGGKRGLFEAAHTGTLLLDEIGDMPLLLQSRLLRVLQEREVVRLGGLAPIPVDVRVIAATHQPLRELVRQRRFREDLFYRINILQITLPPLRARPDDILPMAQRFVARCLSRLGCNLDASRLLAPLAGELTAYPWRGNVRELENISERLGMFFSQFRRVEDVEYATLAVDCPELSPTGGSPAVSTAQQIRDALTACNGNRQEAARYLGISRATLWRRMQSASHETPASGS